MMHAAQRADARPALPHWSRWVVPATIAWSLASAVLGALWWSGGAGYPFTEAIDPQAGLGLVSVLPPAVGAAAIAAFGVAGVGVGLAAGRVSTRGWTDRVVLGWAAVAAVVLAVLVPDYRLLVLAAYAPVFVVGGPLGIVPEGVSFLDAVTWPIVVQAASVVGGFLWAGTGVVHARAARGACARCGRSDRDAAWTAPARARAWGRWAVAVAVAVPLVYAATRFAWALGIPLGISDELLRSGQETGMWVAGAGLATVAVVGAILTTGLASGWGEAVPRWVPRIGGRSIPPMVATLPALLIAALVTAAGLMFIRLFIAGGLERFGAADALGAIGPELLWPIWGVALGAAAVAYHLRRRGPCPECGRARTSA